METEDGCVSAVEAALCLLLISRPAALFEFYNVLESFLGILYGR